VKTAEQTKMLKQQ